MAQVAGRAGRKGKQGLVILQTKSPDLPVIGQVVRNDTEGFYSELMEERQLFRYPPFYHIINVYLRHKDESVVCAAADALGTLLRQWFGTLKLELGIDLAKVRLYLNKGKSAVLQDNRYKTVTVYFDVDPL